MQTASKQINARGYRESELWFQFQIETGLVKPVCEHVVIIRQRRNKARPQG